MARWMDRDWNALVQGDACPICIEGRPTNVIAQVGGFWLTIGQDEAPALPGTCALFARRHVVELHDLDAADAKEFITAVQRVSKLLAQSSDAVKINVEIHGNTIPHLHAHFYPRYRGDPFERTPIDPQRSGTGADHAKHLAIRERLKVALGADGR